MRSFVMDEKRFGSTAFSKLTGISRTTLHNLKENGTLVPNTNKRGHSYYIVSDLLDKTVANLMESKGIKLPKEILSELFGVDENGEEIEKPKPTLQVVKKEADVIPIKQTTTYDRIPEGLITKNIKPLVGMTEAEGVYWRSLLKELIAMGNFHKGDVYTLREYCSCLVQIDGLKIDILQSGNLDDMGKANPLLQILDKYRNSATNYATKLYLTPQSRKDLKTPKKSSDDQQVWDKLLSNKK